MAWVNLRVSGSYCDFLHVTHSRQLNWRHAILGVTPPLSIGGLAGLARLSQLQLQLQAFPPERVYGTQTETSAIASGSAAPVPHIGCGLRTRKVSA